MNSVISNSFNSKILKFLLSDCKDMTIVCGQNSVSFKIKWLKKIVCEICILAEGQTITKLGLSWLL